MRDEIDSFEIADFKRKQRLEDILTEEEDFARGRIECFCCGYVWYQDYIDPNGDVKCPNCNTVENGELFGVAV